MTAHIGKKIKELRKSRIPKLTQKELAQKIGYSQVHISQVERGRKPPGRELLEKLKGVWKDFSVDEALTQVPSEPLPPPHIVSIDLSSLNVATGKFIEIGNFVSFPIQSMGGKPSGWVWLEKEVVGRRRDMAVVQVGREGEIHIVVVTPRKQIPFRPMLVYSAPDREEHGGNP